MKDTDSRELLAGLQQARQAISDAGRPEAVAYQRRSGKLTARERIALFCDPDSFEEFGGLVGPSRETDATADLVAPADGVITGIGRAGGRPVVLMAQDYTVHGGSNSPVGGRKAQRALQYSIDRGLPYIRLLEGGGHRIQDGLDSRHFAGASNIFVSVTSASGWVPTTAAILGPSFGGPTNHSAFADFVVMVRGIATLGMAGPLLVKAGIGQDVDKETLGGVATQVDKTGLADLAVDTEQECMQVTRRYLSYFPSNAGEPPPVLPCSDPADRREESLLDIVPANTRRAYDVRKVVRLIADQDSVFELKPTYAQNLVTALARLDGRSVGFIANNPMRLGGMLNAPACEKAAHFIARCDAFGIPLVFLIDVPGFAIGPDAEAAVMGRRSARMVYELGNATVPRISVVLRKGYGFAYYAMCGGRTFDADNALAWPTAEIAAMSLEGAVDIAYAKEIRKADDPEARRTELIEQFKARRGSLRAAEHFGIDDVIDPRDTRRIIIQTLRTCPARHRSKQPPKFRSISPI